MNKYSIKNISGWGCTNLKICRIYTTTNYLDLHNKYEVLENCETIITRGLGRSYGDAAVNGGEGVIVMTGLNRMLSFNSQTLELECEAGVCLGEILNHFAPRGYFLPVVPGTKFVTVGGAIANDIHGKNHHRDGTFSNYVNHMRILMANGDVVECSPSDNNDLFWSTVGGIGLTGIILTARIQLIRIPSAYMEVDYQYCGDLDEILAMMTATDKNYAYSVAWVDCLARGKHLGRGILMQGNHAIPGKLPDKLRTMPFKAKSHTINLPVQFPNWALNSWSVKVFNSLYSTLNRMKSREYEPYEAFFFPLDSIQNWNRMYGKQGFGQYQATFPYENVDGLVKLFEKLSQSRRASFLAVLKSFGSSGNGLLSYPFPGFTLALDLPNRDNLSGFMRSLDAILLDYGGRIYTAKDFSTDAATFAVMYPRFDEFLALKEQFDPENRFSSSMSRRLGLTPALKGDK